MKQCRVFLVILLISLSGFVLATETSSDVELVTYRNIVDELGHTLKAELLQALQVGGPVAALTTCNEKAPLISAALSQKHQLEVGRTSLKLRNPKNAPDDWELKGLKIFEERQANGEDVSKLELYEITKEAGKKQARYMKAISVAPPCLNCHGVEISPKVSEQLKILYPEDQATGFKTGDLRGAFTLIKALPD